MKEREKKRGKEKRRGKKEVEGGKVGEEEATVREGAPPMDPARTP